MFHLRMTSFYLCSSVCNSGLEAAESGRIHIFIMHEMRIRETKFQKLRLKL